MGHNKEKLDEMGHLHLLLDEMGLDEMGLDEMGINRIHRVRILIHTEMVGMNHRCLVSMHK